MTAGLRVLLVEDDEDDAYLNLRALREAGFALAHERVQTREDMERRLTAEPWDIILSDYSMPRFSAPAALETLQAAELDIPFIVVSGTVGEDVAIDVMRRGAHDYVLKGNLARLAPAVRRELRAAEIRRERRVSDAELRRMEERNRIFLSHCSDTITVVDRDLTIRYATAPVEALVGYRPDEIVGRAFGTAIEPEELPHVRAAMTRLAERGTPGEQFTFEARIRHRNGELRHIECHVRNFLHEPTIEGLVCSTRDVSQRRAMEEERRARLRAELVSKTKSAFLANMSHELRTPLNAIIGFSELMEQGIGGSLSVKHAVYSENILHAGRHLLRLVNDILDLSKIEAGKLTVDREWTSLDPILGGIQETMMPLARRADVTLSMLVPSRSCEIYADPLRLRQILFNLVSNAVKFTKPGGRVDLVARATADESIEISVQDTGIGISENDLPRLFQEFEQLETDGSHHREGTGLGLALTKRLVELHEGEIRVESKLGVGTKFTLLLPGIEKRAAAAAAPVAVAVTQLDETGQ